MLAGAADDAIERPKRPSDAAVAILVVFSVGLTWILWFVMDDY